MNLLRQVANRILVMPLCFKTNFCPKRFYVTLQCLKIVVTPPVRRYKHILEYAKDSGIKNMRP